MDGITLAEVEGFLDGCNDVSSYSIRKTAVEKLQYSVVAVPQLKQTHAQTLQSTDMITACPIKVSLNNTVNS